jgi:hypothetical protein
MSLAIDNFGLQVSDLLYDFYTTTLTSKVGHDYSHIMCELRDDMETETMFSELRQAFHFIIYLFLINSGLVF